LRKVPIATAVFRNGVVEGEIVATPLSGNRLELKVEFTKMPRGKHGFHLHEAGDLRGKGCKGACAHFHKGDPASHGDGPHSKRGRHTGDLGNIEMPHEGNFTKTYVLKGVRVQELWGRSAIVHADEDDLGLGNYPDSKTTGHSGDRIGCAIFGRGICEI
jgi:Cu-Zn family superoxide dismutase